MNTQNVKTAAPESTERWDVKSCLFMTQQLGRFTVKFSAPCVNGGENLNCYYLTSASNFHDAVARFTHETRNTKCTVYAVELTEPVRTVCESTTGYRFVQQGYIWLCLDTEVIVEVSAHGVIRRGDDGQPIPLYGKLICL